MSLFQGAATSRTFFIFSFCFVLELLPGTLKHVLDGLKGALATNLLHEESISDCMPLTEDDTTLTA